MPVETFLPHNLVISDLNSRIKPLFKKKDLEQAYLFSLSYIDSRDIFISDYLIFLFKKSDNDPSGFYKLLICKLLFQFEYFNLCLEEIEKLLNDKIFFDESLNILFKLYKKSKYKIKIHNIFESLYKKYPENNELFDFLIKLYLEENNHSKIIFCYEKILKKDFHNYAIYEKLAQLYIKTHRYKDAAALYKKLYKNNPNYVQRLLPQINNCLSSYPDVESLRFILIELSIKQLMPGKALENIKYLYYQKNESFSVISKLLTKLFNVFPDYPDALLFQSDVFFDQKQYTNSVFSLKTFYSNEKSQNKFIKKKLNKIINVTPKQFLAKLFLCELYLFEKKSDCFFKLFSSIIDSNYSEFKTLDELLLQFENLVTRSPNQHLYLAAKLSAVKKNKDCLTLCEKLLDTPYANESYFIKFKYFINVENIISAKETLHDVLNLNHHMLLNLIPYIKILHQSAIRLEINKINLFIKNDYSQRLYFRLGLLNLRSADLNEAIGYFQKIESKDLLYDHARLLLMRCLYEQGRFSNVLNLCKKHINNSTVQNMKLLIPMYFFAACSAFMLGKAQTSLNFFLNIYEEETSFPCLNEIIKKLRSIPYLDNKLAYLNVIKTNQSHILFYTPDYDAVHYPELQEILEKRYLNAISLLHNGCKKLAKKELESLYQIEKDHPAIFFHLLMIHILDQNNEKVEKLFSEPLCDKLPKNLLNNLKALYFHENNNNQKAIQFIKSIDSDGMEKINLLSFQEQSSENETFPPMDFLFKNQPMYIFLFAFFQRFSCFLEHDALNVYYWINPIEYDYNKSLAKFFS